MTHAARARAAARASCTRSRRDTAACGASAGATAPSTSTSSTYGDVVSDRRPADTAAPARGRARRSCSRPWLEVDPDAELPGDGRVADAAGAGLEEQPRDAYRRQACSIVAAVLGIVVGFLLDSVAHGSGPADASPRRSRCRSCCVLVGASSSRWPSRSDGRPAGIPAPRRTRSARCASRCWRRRRASSARSSAAWRSGCCSSCSTRPVPPSVGSMGAVIATAVCGVVLVAAALVAEHLCTIRKDDDDEHPEATPGRRPTTAEPTDARDPATDVRAARRGDVRPHPRAARRARDCRSARRGISSRRSYVWVQLDLDRRCSPLDRARGGDRSALVLHADAVALDPGGILLLRDASVPPRSPRARRARSATSCAHDDLLFRRGIMFQRFVAVPYGRMQLVDITHGPLDRAFGIAQLKLVTAAAATGVTIPGLTQKAAESCATTSSPSPRPAGPGCERSIRARPHAPAREVRSPLSDGEWHRLHPLTPLLRGGLVFVAIVGIVDREPARAARSSGLLPASRRSSATASCRRPGRLHRQPQPDPDRAPRRRSARSLVLFIGWCSTCRGGCTRSASPTSTSRCAAASCSARTAGAARPHPGRQPRRGRSSRGCSASRKLEIIGAGNDANVQLEYLSTSNAETVRADILRLASGRRAGGGARAGRRGADGTRGAAGGIRSSSSGLNGLIARELTTRATSSPSRSSQHPRGRLIGSRLLSGTTLVLLVAHRGDRRGVHRRHGLGAVLGACPPCSVSARYWVTVDHQVAALLDRPHARRGARHVRPVHDDQRDPAAGAHPRGRGAASRLLWRLPAGGRSGSIAVGQVSRSAQRGRPVHRRSCRWARAPTSSGCSNSCCPGLADAEWPLVVRARHPRPHAPTDPYARLPARAPRSCARSRGAATGSC